MYLKWSVPQVLLDSREVEYRNSLFSNLADLSAEEIAAHCTRMSISQIERFVNIALKETGLRLEGVGLESGAGSGFLSAVCAQRSEVSRMYAVEICEESPKRVIPKVAAYCLGAQAQKVVPVFGTFNDLELEDESIDFIIELHSYHHSHDLLRTLSEAARVLKPGGTVLCFDRITPDSLSSDEVDRMLSVTYSRDFLRHNFYPEDAILTRRENGEHEYRLHEWMDAFSFAGLRVQECLQFDEEVGFKTAAAGVLSSLVPSGLQRGRLKRRSLKDSAAWFRQRVMRSEIASPRATALFVLRKPVHKIATLDRAESENPLLAPQRQAEHSLTTTAHSRKIAPI